MKLGLSVLGFLLLIVVTVFAVGTYEDAQRRAQWRSCANWNTESFFLHARLEDVWDCLRQGANPNARHSAPGDFQDGWSPLHFLGYWRTLDEQKYNQMIFVLIRDGANPHATSADGERAIELIIDSSHHHYFPEDSDYY